MGVGPWKLVGSWRLEVGSSRGERARRRDPPPYIKRPHVGASCAFDARGCRHPLASYRRRRPNASWPSSSPPSLQPSSPCDLSPPSSGSLRPSRIVQGLEVRESRRVLRASALWHDAPVTGALDCGCGSASCVAPHGCLTGALTRVTRAPGSCGPRLPLLRGLLRGLLRSFLRHVSSWFCGCSAIDLRSHPNRWAERSTCTQDVDYG